MMRSAIEKPLNTAPSIRGAVHQSPQAPTPILSKNNESSPIGLIGTACFQQCTEADTGCSSGISVSSQNASSSACITLPRKLATYFWDHSGEACNTQQSDCDSIPAC